MSPVSRARKTKRAPRERVRPARTSPFSPLLDDARDVAAETDPLVAEVWASNVLGLLLTAAWERADEDNDPDELFELELRELIDFFASRRTPAALAGLRALGSAGEEWSRVEALDAAEALAARGVKEPAWLARAEEPELLAVFGAEDEFGDLAAISLAFRRPGGTGQHVLTAFVLRAGEPVLIRLMLSATEDEDEDLRTALTEFATDPESGLAVAEITAAEARDRLERALDTLLCSRPRSSSSGDLFEQQDPDAELGDPNLLWPLLAVRLELLPLPQDEDGRREADGADEDSEDEIAEIERAVGAFLASPRAALLPDAETAGRLATVLADEAVAAGRGPYGLGPMALAVSLAGETFEHLALTGAQAAAFDATVSAWAHFTADERDLAKSAHESWDAQLPEMLGLYHEAYEDPEAVLHRAECPDVIALDEFEPGGDGLDVTDLVENFKRLMAEDGEPGEDEDEDEDED
jgi:CheY-like chemotaxis protein